MTVTISRLYGFLSQAQAAVNSLESNGVPYADISIVANNPTGGLTERRIAMATV